MDDSTSQESPAPQPEAPSPQTAQTPEQAPGQAPAKTGVTVQRPIIVAMLYLVNIVLGFSVFVGIVLAYIWRSEADTPEWEKTHYTYLITTFWVGFILSLAGMLVWFGAFFATIPFEPGRHAEPHPAFFIAIFGMFFVWLLLAGWFCIRCILSLVKAAKCEPMPRPRTWLF